MQKAKYKLDYNRKDKLNKENKAGNSAQAEHLIPEQTEHMIPEMTEHLKPERKYHIINLI